MFPTWWNVVNEAMTAAAPVVLAMGGAALVLAAGVRAAVVAVRER